MSLCSVLLARLPVSLHSGGLVARLPVSLRSAGLVARLPVSQRRRLRSHASRLLKQLPAWHMLANKKVGRVAARKWSVERPRFK